MNSKKPMCTSILTTAFLMLGLWQLVTRTQIGRAMRAASFDLDYAALRKPPGNSPAPEVTRSVNHLRLGEALSRVCNQLLDPVPEGLDSRRDHECHLVSPLFRKFSQNRSEPGTRIVPGLHAWLAGGRSAHCRNAVACER